MQYLIDTANLEDIRRCAAAFPISGMTTNPDILSREKKEPFELYKQIHKEFPQLHQFHIQVVSESAEEIIREAAHVCSVLIIEGGIPSCELFVKIPMTGPGIMAMRQLNKDGISFTATGIFTAVQCLLAADLGASFAAPYITPIIACGGDGIGVVRKSCILLKKHGHGTKILAAGFSTGKQISDATLAGTDIVTVPAVMFNKFLHVPQADAYTGRFNQLFRERMEGNTLLEYGMLKKTKG